LHQFQASGTGNGVRDDPHDRPTAAHADRKSGGRPQAAGPQTSGRSPAFLWNPTFNDVVFAADGFHCVVIGTTNIPIVVETCTDLRTGHWVPMETNTLTGGVLDFHDPRLAATGVCFYRLAAP